MRRLLDRCVASASVAIISSVAIITGLTVVSAGPTATAGAVTAAGVEVSARAGLSVGPGILWESDANQTRDLDQVAASGAKWINIDIDWNHIQDDGPNVWRWNAATDRVVLNARAHGLNIIGTAAYSPGWARTADCPPGNLHCLAANPDDYGRFVGAAAARYGANSPFDRLRGSITNWQIWNEPNHQEFSQPRPDPDRYTAMLKSAYVAVKAADSGATVITGGTSPASDAADGTDYSPETWLRGLYARGARGFFDAVGHHPYMFPTNPLEAHSWNAFTQTQFLYDVMVANGDASKKVWGTEMGAPSGTDPEALTEAQQAQWVHDYFLGWNTTFRAFTGPMIWFQLRDSGSNLANRWDNLGLLRLDGSQKPAYSEFQNVMAGGVGSTTPIQGDGWQALGGGMTSGPASSSWGPNRIDTFARGSDAQLWHKFYAGQWYGWESLGAPSPGFIGDPAAVSWAPGRVDVFVRGTDNHLWHRVYADQWFPWEDLGGTLASSPTVSSMSFNRLDVFAKATDNQLQHTYWNVNSWSGWEKLGGVLTADPGAVSWGFNRIDVFARGSDNQLWHKFFGGSAWSAWEPLGGGLGSGPAVSSWGPNRLDAFVVGTGGGLWHLWFEGTGWHGWEPLGGALTADPDATSWARNRIDVFARGSDNQLWHRSLT